MYSVVGALLLGRLPSSFTIHKVKGHAKIEEAVTDRERFEAKGNDHADRVAKSAAAQQVPSSSQPSGAPGMGAAEYYVPAALSKWPAVSPVLGKRALPRRLQDGERVKGQSSFASDVLGPWHMAPPPPPRPRRSLRWAMRPGDRHRQARGGRDRGDDPVRRPGVRAQYEPSGGERRAWVGQCWRQMASPQLP